MRRALPIAVFAALALAGCGGGGGGGGISSADKAACDTLDQYGDAAEGGDPTAAGHLFSDLGGIGTNPKLSKKLAPYALLVSASGQVASSGGDSAKLGDYVGQMRGVCESMGWKASS